jgi:hypothetical protein
LPIRHAGAVGEAYAGAGDGVESAEEAEEGTCAVMWEAVQRHMLPAWATKPEMIVTYFLFVLAALISIYSVAIRQFLKILFTVPPSKIGRAWRKASLRGYETELLKLKRLHGNAYELLLYAIIEIGRMAISAAFVVALLLIVVLRMKEHYTSPEELGIAATLVLVTIPLFLVFPMGSIFIQCQRLVQFEKRVGYLEKKIADLSAGGR